MFEQEPDPGVWPEVQTRLSTSFRWISVFRIIKMLEMERFENPGVLWIQDLDKYVTENYADHVMGNFLKDHNRLQDSSDEDNFRSYILSTSMSNTCLLYTSPSPRDS